MLAKIKQYLEYVGVALIALLSIFAIVEKKKADEDEVKIDEQKTLNATQKIDNQVKVNDSSIAAEEAKQAKIEKETKDAQSNTADDVADFLNKR